MNDMELTVELREGALVAPEPIKMAGATLVLTPPIDEDFWLARVKVGEHQAVVAFPKFFTIGIGFQYEEDWNTNLPFTSGATEIYEHIAHNKNDDSIPRERCIRAIELLQEVAHRWKASQVLAGKEPQ